MLEYKRLKKDRRQLLALTGLTPKEFGALHKAFCVAYATAYPRDKTAEGRGRKRQSGGRKGQLGTTEQQLLFSLVYVKTYPLQALLGAMFGLSQSRVNRWLPRLLPIVKHALEELGVLPQPRAGAVCRAGTGVPGAEVADYRRHGPSPPAPERQGATDLALQWQAENAQ